MGRSKPNATAATDPATTNVTEKKRIIPRIKSRCWAAADPQS
jgi:hypothetical protein